MNREEAIDILFGCIEAHSEEENEALDMAIEALKHEDHDGCDGCRYEANHELSLPCVGCKQNYVDKYVPMPEHDREWIIGCIKHDGFVKTDRGDKANQIILDALSADNTSTNTSTKSTNISTNTSTKSTNISTDTSADIPRGEWISKEELIDAINYTEFVYDGDKDGHKEHDLSELVRVIFKDIIDNLPSANMRGENK